MTLNFLMRQSSFLDLCPVTAAVEELANLDGIEERGAIFTRREVVDFILDLAVKIKGARLHYFSSK